MRGLIRKVYSKLPGIREICAIRDELRAAREASCELEIQRIIAGGHHQDPRNLVRHEFQVFSQGGEDGILAEVFRRIGAGNRTFLEIGAGDGLQNNTAFLLLQGWSGYWIDADKRALDRARRNATRFIDQGRLKIRRELATMESVEPTLGEMGVPEEIDLLSLDVDRNTYWILAAIRNVRPRVIVVEYNASMGPSLDWKVPYHPTRAWNRSVYYGASLKAFEMLARKMGYALVGCTTSGVNAFFVRDDLCGDKFQPPPTSELHYEPPRYHLLRIPYYASALDDEQV